MHLTPSQLWAGTGFGGDDYLNALKMYSDAVASGRYEARGGTPTREDMGMTPLLQVDRGVGVITIRGKLVAGMAGYMAYYGMLGYDDIRLSVLAALNNLEVRSILLNISSGGGETDGLEDVGSFISMASKVKPITTYTDGNLASAAYWIGSYGAHIATNQTSTIGSLGILALMVDRTEQMKQDGVKINIIRAGRYKALSNPYEPNSDEAMAVVQKSADTLYKVFIDTVSANRGVSYQYADQTMGQGREFMGAEALSVKLVDKLMTFEEAFMLSKSMQKT